MSPPYFTVTILLALLLPLLNLVGRNLALDNDGACPYPCNQPPQPPYPLYGYPPPPPSPSGYPLYFPPPPPPRPHCPPFPAECCHPPPPPPYPYVFPPPGAKEPLGTGGGTAGCSPTVAVCVTMLVLSYLASVL
ncbi:PREDICTED: formin-like protein 5 [Tarenaya hassleriana]|uniref:formin-like protein 5 n=1 Tax=Tarenaya hassleriana TaxID=28532 RepID=UPI00053C9792|nr:PREDICTED: formin-like protein 5 [Tarenaya hassleriana]